MIELLEHSELLFWAKVGYSSRLDGKVIMPRDIDVLIDGVRQGGVTEAYIRDDGFTRTGVIEWNPKRCPTQVVGTGFAIEIHDPSSGRMVRSFTAKGCRWTRSAMFSERWGFRGRIW